MSQPHDDLLAERIEVLERSNRRWRAIALGSMAVLALFLVVLGISHVFWLRAAIQEAEQQRVRAEENELQAREQMERALEAEREARMIAADERAQVEKARRDAEDAVEKAKQGEQKAKEEVSKALYRAEMLLAERLLDQQKLEKK